MLRVGASGRERSLAGPRSAGAERKLREFGINPEELLSAGKGGPSGAEKIAQGRSVVAGAAN